MKLRLLAVLVFIFASILTINFNARVEAQNQAALTKIAPWVLEHVSNGQEAEFLVVLAEQADLSYADTLRTKEEKGWYVYRTLYEKAEVTQKPMLNWLESNGIEHQSFYIVNMILVKGRFDVALSLAARPDVARIDANPVVHNNLPQFAPAPGKVKPAAVEAIEPGISQTNAPQVWALGYTGQGIVVGGADTGYLWTHNALKPHYRGWNGLTASHDYNWHDSIHSSAGPCAGNQTQPCDDHGHGTHTVGTTTGDDGAGNQIGMAPGAKWIGCRNMDQGNGTPATYIECFQFFLAPYPVSGTPAQGDPTKAPDVTTNSWNCPPSEGCSAASLQAAVAAQRAAGIVTVVAAGNSGSSCSTVTDPPAIYAESLTVGALNTGQDTIASFSSRGPVTSDGSNRQKPDIAAPGTSTRSAYRTTNTTYQSLSGTSMATPHVAGAVALLLSAQPSLRGKVAIIEGILKDSAFHINSSLCSSNGTFPNNVFGYGRLNIKAATDMALTTFAPQSAAFTAAGAEGTLNVLAPAGAPWTATTTASWITILTPGGTGNGTVSYVVRDNPDERFRTATITIARRDFTVRQEGFGQTGCTYQVTPMSQSFPSGGGAGSLNIAASEECIWSATSGVPWITITSDNGGLGVGTVTFTVGVNNSGATRKGTININGAVFTVKQKFP